MRAGGAPGVEAVCRGAGGDGGWKPPTCGGGHEPPLWPAFLLAGPVSPLSGLILSTWLGDKQLPLMESRGGARWMDSNAKENHETAIRAQQYGHGR